MLTVTQAFSNYKPGDSITDEAEVKAVLESENAARVVRVADAPKETFTPRK